MITRSLMTAAFALAMAAGPALAQDTMSSGGQSTTTTTPPGGTGQPMSGTTDGTMAMPPADGTMATTPTDGSAQADMAAKPAMLKSQMAAMQKCQAMTSDMMMKNKKCMKMAKMHPEMMQGATPATTG